MTTATQPRTWEILLVDDNWDDVQATAVALKKVNLRHNLSVVEDGHEALNFLRRQGTKFAEAPRPDLILLDVNVSRRDGLAALAAIKSDHHLMIIPVVVFTESAHERDIFNAYAHNANSYVTKPDDEQGFAKVIHSVMAYWFGTAKRFPH